MKKIFFLFLVAAMPTSSRADEIPGFVHGDVKATFELAKKKNQMIMIDFFTTWCGPCKLLDKNIYMNERFKTYTEKMVCYKIDAEKGEGVALAEKYKVTNYPSVLFVDASGNEIERKLGYDSDADHYFKELDRIIDGKDILPKWVEGFEKEKSVESAIKLASYYSTMDIEKAERYYQFVMAADPNTQRQETVSLMSRYAMQQLQYKQLPKYAESFIQRFPKDEETSNLTLTLAFFYAQHGEKEKGWELFSDLYNQADEKKKNSLSNLNSQLRQITGHTTKEEDYEFLATLNLKSAADASKAVKIHVKYKEADKAQDILLNWLKANPNGSLDELNDLGWTSFEIKLACKEYAGAIISAWNTAQVSEQDSYKADTIANLCEAVGDKTNAIKFGEIAVKLTPTQSKKKKGFEENLNRYRAMK